MVVLVLIKELTRLTIAIRDDIHNLNRQVSAQAAGKKGWFGGGSGGCGGEDLTVPAIPEALQFDQQESTSPKPENVSYVEHGSITRAVMELDLHAS